MKRCFGCVLTIIALIFCCSGCTEEEKHWWDDRENVTVKVTIDGAEPEFLEFRPGTHYPGYTPVERTFDGTVIEPKIQVFWQGEEVTEWGLELDMREQYDTDYEAWLTARNIQYPGEYRVRYSIYQGEPLETDFFYVVSIKVIVKERIN